MLIKMKVKKASQISGFTLLEIVIALALMVIIFSVIAGMFFGVVKFYNYYENNLLQSRLEKAITTTYEKDAMQIDSPADPATQEISFSWDNQSEIFSNGMSSFDMSNPAGQTPQFKAFTHIANIAGGNPLNLEKDAWGHPYKIFVSPLLKTTYDGFPLFFHDIAFVSNNDGSIVNGNPVINSTFSCQASGCSLNLAKGESGFMVSGYNIESKLYQETLDSMSKLGNAYSNYFTSKYLDNTQRNYVEDYFYNASDSSNNSIQPTSGNVYFPGNTSGSNAPSSLSGYNSSGQLMNSTGNNFLYALGFSSSAYTSNEYNPNAYSAWGYGLFYSNDSPGLRYQGENNDGYPPYTAAIYAWAPNGVLLSKFITGTY